MRLRAPACLFLLAVSLGGCSSVGNVIGVLAGAAAGGASANPAVGFGVGVATAAASDYTLKLVTRRWHHTEQNAIAAAAAPLPVGGQAPWRVVHSLPIGNEHGQLAVVDAVDTKLAACKRVLFSVDAGKQPPAWYSVDICQDTEGWRWASAEPAVARWGFLQ